MPMRVRLLALLSLGAISACGSSSPASMEFVEILPAQPRLGDVVTVRFRLIDERGVPLAGANVGFKLAGESTDGITLSPPTTTSLKGSGFAETQLVASARVNSVIVVATSGDKQVNSPPITFAGSLPNGRQFTFQCGTIAGTASGGIHAIGAYDETRHLIAGTKVKCTAHVGDRSGDGVPNALVSFFAEAGTIGPTNISLSDVVGNAEILYKTSLPFPTEVAPDTFSWTPLNDDQHSGAYLAPLWMHPYDWSENPVATAQTPLPRTYSMKEPRRPDPVRLKADASGRYENNPRDNLVSMVAVTAGEEGYSDDNNNGRYDMGEPFDDLTEPFVDNNDNGTWDEGERYIDVNGNRKWDGKNGKWDANSLIWVQERLLWTGLPTDEDRQLNVPGVTGNRPVATILTGVPVTLRCPGGVPVGGPCAQAVDTVSGGPALVTAYLSDPWFNAIAQDDQGDGCDIEQVGNAPVELKASVQSGLLLTYPPGFFLSFFIGDKRDPNVPPDAQIPKRAFPIGFIVTLVCNVTTSPLEGAKIKVPLGVVTGTID
jgi:hypothetical protein